MAESPRSRQLVLDELLWLAGLPDTMGWATIGFTVAEARVLIGHIEVLNARIRQANEKLAELIERAPSATESGS